MSMPPIVNFYEKTTDLDLQDQGWDLGEMKADEDSAELEVRIWNNRGGNLSQYQDEFFVNEGDNVLELTHNVVTEEGVDEDLEEFPFLVYSYNAETNNTSLIEETNYTLSQDETTNVWTVTLEGDYAVPEQDAGFRVTYFTYDDFKTSYMKDITLFILDENEEDIKLIVQQGWVQAKCDSLGETSFTVLDKEGELILGAEGLQVDGEPTVSEISGEINNGENEGDNLPTSNFADTTLKMEVPYNADATENKPFYVVVRYFYT